jgi:hypothetical protein
MLIFLTPDEVKKDLEYADQHDDHQGSGDAVFHELGITGD